MTDNRQIHPGSSGVEIAIDTGVTISQGAARHGLAIRQDCGGKGVCGQCRITAAPHENLTPMTDAERRHLSPDEIDQGSRLACQVRLTGPVRLWIPETSLSPADVHGKASFSCQLDADPLVERLFLDRATVPLVMEGQALSLAGWIGERVRETSGVRIRLRDHRILSALGGPGVATGPMTLVNHEEHGVTAVWQGNRPESLGVAFDIGTTTLAAYLCDLSSGAVRSSASAANPQGSVGSDVISRISHCDREEGGLDNLRRRVVEGMNGLVRKCLKDAGMTMEAVDEVVVVGNPTMIQIAAGLHPHTIGVSPYLPLTSHIPDLPAEVLDLDLHPGVNVHFFPVISGFLGGDTLSAVVADGLHLGEDTTLLVDIGTNGELVLGDKTALWATSCATGPALEGAQISCGMRAANGAIDRVFLGPGGEIDYRVLGEKDLRPKGICGSGIVDLMAALRRAGGLDASGRFAPGFPGVVVDEKGVGRKFVLVPSADNAPAGEIAVTLKDVRQFQLAKAALAVGIGFLMDRVGVTAVSRTVLTGAFGARFDWRSALATGMLPASLTLGRIEPKTNLAGVGAVMGLVNRCHREAAHRLQQRIRFVEMAGDPTFAARFAAATAFPDLQDISDLWES